MASTRSLKTRLLSMALTVTSITSAQTWSSPTGEADGEEAEASVPVEGSQAQDAATSEDERAYQTARDKFLAGDYEGAINDFGVLFGRSQRKASVAYALAQSHRYMGDFALALYYYQQAKQEYERIGKALPPGSEKNLTVVRQNVAQVTVKVGEAYRGKVCDIDVNGVPLTKSPGIPVAASSSPETASASVAPTTAWVGGSERVTGGLGPTGERCPSGDFVLMLSTTGNYKLRFRWGTAGALAPSNGALISEIDITNDQLKNGVREIDVASVDASLELKWEVIKSNGSRTKIFLEDDRSVSAFLEGLAGASYRISQKRPSPVPAGSYDIKLEVDGYDITTDLEKPIVLFPAAHHARTIELKEQVPFYKKTGWQVGGIAVVAAGLVAGGYFLWKAGEESPRENVDSGSLGWSVRVP
jgi:hypothetical protein